MRRAAWIDDGGAVWIEEGGEVVRLTVDRLAPAVVREVGGVEAITGPAGANGADGAPGRDGADGRDAELPAGLVGSVEYASDLDAVRPAGFGRVDWIGFPSRPTNMVAGDLWMRPA